MKPARNKFDRSVSQIFDLCQIRILKKVDGSVWDHVWVRLKIPVSNQVHANQIWFQIVDHKR